MEGIAQLAAICTIYVVYFSDVLKVERMKPPVKGKGKRLDQWLLNTVSNGV
jgi:hypothetical protein